MPLTQSPYSMNESIIYTILKENNYNLAQICGILANIDNECGFNPRALNPNEGAYGLCQWRDGRRSALHDFARSSSPTVKVQTHFIFREFSTTEKKAYSHFSGIKDDRNGARTAGINFAQYYERCAQEYRAPRGERAVEYWDYYSNTENEPSLDINTDLSYTETSDPPTIPSSVPSFITLSSADVYQEDIKKNLSRVTAEGFDYGYLIDMTYGGEFKFYIPEFNEAAGANWGDISIPGRSVTIKSYGSTNSRSITISLDLYAGVGLYSSSDDVVKAMHDDLNFVKSLEYPDYDSTAIVRPPATVHLILGSAINIQGIVHGVSIQHLKPLDAQNRAMYAKLSFTVTQTASTPPSYLDIRDGISALISTDSPATLDVSTPESNSTSESTTITKHTYGR